MTDFFEDLLANAGNAPRANSAPEGYRSSVEQFIEGCRKCGGSGFWHGRAAYPCFTCKGKGKIGFKTSPQARANGAANRETRKAKTEQEILASFAASHPDIWAWIDGNSFQFAVSLRDSVVRFGMLTPNQLAAAERCVEKRKASVAARQASVASAPSIDIGKIEEAFKIAASNGLKRMKLRIAGFTFSPAPTTGKNAGAIYVKRSGDYLGKVQGGKLMCVSSLDNETRDRVLAIAADPKSAATVHGLQTGVCSCCGAELTNKESIARGIGPVCAANYGW